VPTKLDRELLGRVSVAAKGHNSAAVTAEGILFVWGDGQFCQLGLGDNLSRQTPQCLKKELFAGSEVLMVTFGLQHMLIVSTLGELWSCCENSHVVLGNNTYASQLFPTRVDVTHFNGARVATVVAGRHISMALTQGGMLYSWGRFCTQVDDTDEDLSTGLGHALHKLLPTRINPLRGHMPDARFGRCRRLPREHALAFVMSWHSRLGYREDRDNDMVDLVVVDGVLVELVDDDCTEYGVDAETVRSVMRDTVIPDMKKCWLSLLDESLVRIMVNLCGDWPKGRARELQGVARLMGGT
jgi:hypothetical protein